MRSRPDGSFLFPAEHDMHDECNTSYSYCFLLFSHMRWELSKFTEISLTVLDGPNSGYTNFHNLFLRTPKKNAWNSITQHLQYFTVAWCCLYCLFYWRCFKIWLLYTYSNPVLFCCIKINWNSGWKVRIMRF